MMTITLGLGAFRSTEAHETGSRRLRSRTRGRSIGIISNGIDVAGPPGPKYIHPNRPLGFRLCGKFPVCNLGYFAPRPVVNGGTVVSGRGFKGAITGEPRSPGMVLLFALLGGFFGGIGPAATAAEPPLPLNLDLREIDPAPADLPELDPVWCVRWLADPVEPEGASTPAVFRWPEFAITVTSERLQAESGDKGD